MQSVTPEGISKNRGDSQRFQFVLCEPREEVTMEVGSTEVIIRGSGTLRWTSSRFLRGFDRWGPHVSLFF